jgi:hypothetical protein
VGWIIRVSLIFAIIVSFMLFFRKNCSFIIYILYSKSGLAGQQLFDPNSEHDVDDSLPCYCHSYQPTATAFGR